MFVTPGDLEAFATIDAAKAAAMIEDAEAMAALAAPCLSDPEFQSDVPRVAAVKAILRGAILRWHEAGAGALSQKTQTAGPFNQSESFDTRQQRRGMFWPSEITQLRDLCDAFNGDTSSGVFSVDTVPTSTAAHSVYCALAFGANYCSCGADINGAGGPLYEGGQIW